MELKPQEITNLLKKQILNYHSQVEQNDTGTVVTVGDGIARVYGLANCMSNELIQFNDDVYGMALNLEQDFVGAVLLGSDENIKEGDPVKRTGKIVSVPVGEALLGRVVN
ncbi:MAG: F0F1 ATP synthase subunit alpha, partial [Oscillospiraceae bacterium]